MGAVNAETNDGSHTMLRAAKEAADLNAWFNCDEASGGTGFCQRLKFRTASFCNERSGHFDAFDQGISFFLPNMTWIQVTCVSTLTVQGRLCTYFPLL